WWPVAGIAAALVAWLVQGAFSFDTFDLSILAWVLAGSALASSKGAQLRLGRAAPIALAAMALITLAFGAVNFIADRTVQADSGRPAARAAGLLIDAERLRPRSFDTYSLLAAVAMNSGDPAILRQAHSRLAA